MVAKVLVTLGHKSQTTTTTNAMATDCNNEIRKILTDIGEKSKRMSGEGEREEERIWKSKCTRNMQLCDLGARYN